MANSEEGLRRPEILFPVLSVMTSSSGDIMPLEMPVGEVSTRLEPRRREIFPSVAAMKLRSWNQRPTAQMSRRCSSSLLSAPCEMDSESMFDPSVASPPQRVPPTRRGLFYLACPAFNDIFTN